MLVWGGRSSTVTVGNGGTYYHSVDDDLDGFTECDGDCDDTRSFVYPGAPQQCDGWNNDCDDPTWPAATPGDVDADGDQFFVCAGDCDDSRTSVHPGTSEACDGLDNDCNQLIDDDSNGVDADSDGVPGACDNCPTVSNQNQTNDDGDALGNACDCRPTDSTTMQIPASVSNLRLAADSMTISWDSLGSQAGSATVYDVLRGVLGEWPVGQGPSETCLASALVPTSLQDPLVPAAHTGFFYLVRGRNPCGVGTYAEQAPMAATATFAGCP